jgi:hypothetical protein
MKRPNQPRGKQDLQEPRAHTPLRRHATIVAARVLLESYPLFVAGAVCIAIGLPMLLWPFGPDQAIFAYIAHRILLGGFPYVSAWDQKPPAIYLVYIVAMRFPGPLMRNVRLFDLCFLLVTMLAVYLLGRRLWGKWSGAFAALLYGTAYATEYGYWHTAQPDGYTALPLCIAVWLYYRALRTTQRLPYVLAGLLTGFAFQLRFFSALMGLALIYIEWNNARALSLHGWAAAIKRIAWFSVGFALMQALLAGYLLVGHALGAYLFTEFRFATGYAHLGGPYSPGGFQWGLYFDAARTSTVDFLVSHAFVSLPAGVAVAMALRRNGDRHAQEIGLLALSAYLGVLIQAKFFLYHWLAVLPFVALLGGRGLVLCAEYLGCRRRQVRSLVAFAAILALLVFVSPAVTDSTLHQWRGVQQYYAGQISRSRFNNQFGPYAGGTFSYLADDQVARYVEDHSQTGDTIYIYGYEALVYLIAKRESASRFFYVFPVISTWSPPAWRSELFHDLYEKKPRFILVQANEGAPWITGLHEDTAHNAAQDPDLQALLASRYERDVTIEDFSLYRLR